MEFQAQYEAYKNRIEAALDGYFQPDGRPFDGLFEAMRYSLLSGGKRVRPVLTLAFAEAAGGNAEAALPVACAVEMLHTYSLIHDDLPCMDNDDLRRGRPTNHKAFNEYTAMLAGDALQAEAFGVILRSGLSPERKAACAEYLAGATGAAGICGGQFMDMVAEGTELNKEQLFDVIERKTGALLVAACVMGVLAVGGTAEQQEAACQYGAALGLAFQLRDDVLDQDGLCEVLGEAECERRIGQWTKLCGTLVRENFGDSEFLRALAENLAYRTN
ncbi:MAG: polyprenyl synthetase family protein [Firmicutes bacterium]|nr:polyprenyl synthetase family protein [Bacillota bacterium]